MENWNDLRLVLAIVRGGSLTAAATALAVAHSTAFRRLAALESRLGVRLFERLPAGAYEPTAAGERMAVVAEQIETETAALDRELLGADLRLSGRLRITCAETLAFRLLTPCVAEFRRQHPGITLEVAPDNRVFSLSRREADIALRVSRRWEGDLYRRKLADIGWTLYGRPELLARLGPIQMDALGQYPFVGWEENVTQVNSAAWLRHRLPAAALVYRTNSVLGQMAAAREGVGLALLPCYVADAEPRLERAVAAPLPELSRELWIVTHADLRRTARVRAFMDLAAQRFAQMRKVIAGERADVGLFEARLAETPHDVAPDG